MQRPLPLWMWGSLVWTLWIFFGGQSCLGAASNAFPAKPLSLADALNTALLQNAAILKSTRDVEAMNGIVIQTRAVALPKIRGSANYKHNQAVERLDFSSLTGTPESGINEPKDQWAGNIRVVQSIYEGGRITSALRTAPRLRQQALLQHRAVVADTLLAVRTAYYDVLLAEQQVVVQEASIKLLTEQWETVNRRFSAGIVTRFEVLQAEVELANARPRLIQAKNAYRLAKNNLVNLLGCKIPPQVWEDIPLDLSDKLEETPYNAELPKALAQALLYRPELGALRVGLDLRQEAIVTARSGYQPGVDIFGGYGARNPGFEDDFLGHLAGPNAGVEFNWNIFSGGETRGQVAQAQALYDKARVEIADVNRNVELEVRTAYSTLVEAQQLLASQSKVQEQAEEALRLAKTRYQAGTGTQLDLLSAQTALTQARTTQAQALRDYAVARARLGRAVGEDVPASEQQ